MYWIDWDFIFNESLDIHKHSKVYKIQDASSDVERQNCNLPVSRVRVQAFKHNISQKPKSFQLDPSIFSSSAQSAKLSKKKKKKKKKKKIGKCKGPTGKLESSTIKADLNLGFEETTTTPAISRIHSVVVADR